MIGQNRSVCGLFIEYEYFDRPGWFVYIVGVGAKRRRLDLLFTRSSAGAISMPKTSAFSFIALALTVGVCIPALAGGGANIPVRMKNVGVDPVSVNSKTGNQTQAQILQGARVIAANGIAQFQVKKGNFTAIAADPDAPTTVNKLRNFSTRKFPVIYLWAQQDNTTATLVGAPAGVKF